jgi:hypothetical protein
VARQQRNEGRRGEAGEALRRRRSEHGGFVAVSEQRGLARIERLHHQPEDGGRGLGKIPFRSDLRPEVGQHLERGQQLSDVVSFHCHPEERKRTTGRAS